MTTNGNEPISTRDGSDDEAILREARERAARAYTAWKHNFDAAQEDVRFLAGDQWPESVRMQRDAEGRPCLTLNKLPQYVDQVIGDQRQNRPAISVHPVEDNAVQKAGREEQQVQGQGKSIGSRKIQSTVGNSDYTLAEVYEALIRNIEYTSNAEAQYDKAFQHAVEGGFGWLRVIADYSTDSIFDQDLYIRAIHNRFAVLLDPDAIEPDYSDAEWGFISERMSRAEFQRRYPGKSAGDVSAAEHGEYAWWVNEEGVRVAEYFRREPTTRTLLLMSDGSTMWEDEVNEVLDELAEKGITVSRSRNVKTHVVKWMKISAFDVLESERDWRGKTIPIIPVLGKETTIGDKTYYRGLIRHAKDAQRMHNYWMTAATERVALAPKAPWIAPAEAIEGYEDRWETANTSNHSVLMYNALPGIDRPTRDQPPSMPAAELQLALSATDEMKATIGLYDASIGNQGNEQSGKAILARQRQGDRGTFAYIDNLSRAIRRVGMVLIEMIPKTYDGERVIRLRFEDGEGDWVKINETIIDEETQQPVLVSDIAVGKFDVTVKAGPSYQTQRMEAADSLLQFVQAVPAAGGVIMDLIAQNMDWPGAKEIALRLKKIVPPGVLDSDEMAENGIQPPPPTPEQQVESAKAEAAIVRAQADVEVSKVETQARIAEAEASVFMAQAKSAEAQAALAQVSMQAQFAGPGSIEETVRNLVADAIAEFMSAQ